MLEEMDARLFYEYSPPTTPPRAIISHTYLGQNLEDIPLHIIPSQDSKLPTYTIHEEIVAPSLSQEATSLLQPTPLTTLQTTLLMVALCTAVFLAALDTVILTTALPTITASLHTSTSGAAWIGSSFMLANASSVPFWGSASDIFGRKPLLLLANSIFMTGSIISALAGNLAILLAGRSIQGIGAGGITVLVNIIVSDVFVMRTRSLMLTLVGSVWFFAATIGPVIGGTFAERAGWRWCFWVNAPFNITSFILLTHLLRLHTPHTSLLKGLALLDWPGFLTLPTGTTLLLLGLEFGGTSSSWFSPLVLSLLFSGALILALFLIIESRIASNPLIPLHLFSSLSTISTLLVCTAHAMCYISVAYFLPYYFQAILSFSPLFSGLWSLITAFTLLFTTLSCGWYMHSTGRYLELIRFGLAFLVVGFGLFTTFSSSLSVPRMVIFQIVMSLGLGPLFQAPLVALQAHLEKKDIATGTATFGFVRMLSAGISVVVGELIFQSQMRKRAHLFISSEILPAIAERISSGSSAVGTVLLGELTQAQRYVVRGAQSQSLNSVWMFCIAVAAVGLISGFGVRGREMSKVDEETMELKSKRVEMFLVLYPRAVGLRLWHDMC